MDMEIDLETGSTYDPRIKSPDDILKRAPNVRKFDANQSPQETIAQLQREIQQLRQRYNTDISEWKEYEQRVTKWKELVMQVVQQLKAEGKIKSI